MKAGKAFWGVGGNCVWCGEAGRCVCAHKVTAEQLTRAAQAIVEGLNTDGAHHKQYYLEEAARLMGASITGMRNVHRYNIGIPS